MTKILFPGRLLSLLVTLICFIAISSLAGADERFTIAIGAIDKLIVSGPKGDQATEIPVPSIGQAVTVGGTSFQVSCGRDSRGQITAILTPNADSPAALHFTVLGKAVDADKAVVTLIFSSNMKSVTVKAGYGGRVEVNSHRIGRTNPTP